MHEIDKEQPTALHKHTKLIFAIYKIFGSPLEGLFYIFAFILYKDLNASPLQLTILVSSKPAVALLSFYGNLLIKDRASNLKSTIILFNFLGSIPCFFFPFVNNVWYMIFAHGLFMLSLRAVIPAWSEILKINLKPTFRSRVFAKGSMANYAINIVIPLLVSPLLDIYPHSWKWLFFTFAILNCFNALLLASLRLKTLSVEGDGYHPYHFHSPLVFIDPWRKGWVLIKEHADFRGYQIVFMFCGAGLMFMQPVLPVFFKDTLHLSYLQLTCATSFCKGLSFVMTSPFWAKWLCKTSIHTFNFIVFCFATLFSLFVIGSQSLHSFIFLAYLFYGMMQAGSELSWNLSGPIFSKDKDSTLYTGINVAAVGIRGCIAPFLGELVFVQTQNPIAVFICGGVLCLIASLYSLSLANHARRTENVLTSL